MRVFLWSGMVILNVIYGFVWMNTFEISFSFEEMYYVLKNADLYNLKYQHLENLEFSSCNLGAKFSIQKSIEKPNEM